MLYQLPSKPEKENQFASNGNNDGSETENWRDFVLMTFPTQPQPPAATNRHCGPNLDRPRERIRSQQTCVNPHKNFIAA